MSSVDISEVFLTKSVLRLSSTRISHSVNGVVKKMRLTNVWHQNTSVDGFNCWNILVRHEMMLTVINANINSSNDRRMTWSLRYGWFGDFTIESRCAASTRRSNSGSVNTGSHDVTVQAIPISDLQTLPMLC